MSNTKLLIAAIGDTDDITEYMSPVAAAKLAVRYHTKTSFLTFAKAVAKQAKRLKEQQPKAATQPRLF